MAKASKKRHCPALGGPITPADCGENRISVHPCPADCRYNPFSPTNYDQLLRIDDELEPKSLERLFRKPGDRPALETWIQEAQRDRSPHALTARFHWELYFRNGADGRTVTNAWLQEGIPELKNDERVVLRGRSQMRVALLEIHRILDDRTLEAVDLLSTVRTPLPFVDRHLAGSAMRFTTLVGWIFPMPHFWRVFGSAIEIPTSDTFDSLEIVTEIVRHLGGPIDEAGVRRWLAEHFARFDHALLALSVTWRRQMFASCDAMLGRAVYELRRPFAECVEILDRLPEVEPDPLNEGESAEGFADARVWLDPEQQAMDQVNEALLGRVLLGQSHFRLEAWGAAPLEDLKRRFERQLGDRVRFTGQRLDNLAAAMLEKDPKIDEALVPPALRKKNSGLKLSIRRTRVPITAKPPQELAVESMAEMDRKWLDESIPALEGMTPRQAAATPNLRPILIRLMQSRIRSCDEQNLRTGSMLDVNWMLHELGLTEILFDPPPWRPPPESEADDEAESAVAVPPGAPRPDLPPAPRPPDRPFTREELVMMVDAELMNHETVLEAVERAEDEGCTLLEEVREITEKLVSPEVFSLLIMPLLCAWRVFVPHGTLGPDWAPARLIRGIQREMEALLQTIKRNDIPDFHQYLRSGPQPDAAELLANMVFNAAESFDSHDSLDANHLVSGVAVLRAVIAELDTASRER